jgi:hypothetical protein
MNSQINIEEQLEQLDCAESFFELFDVPFDPDVIIHRRIHLLRLFHLELGDSTEGLTWADYQTALKKAYCKIQLGDKAEFAESGCNSCTKCED